MQDTDNNDVNRVIVGYPEPPPENKPSKIKQIFRLVKLYPIVFTICGVLLCFGLGTWTYVSVIAQPHNQKQLVITTATQSNNQKTYSPKTSSSPKSTAKTDTATSQPVTTPKTTTTTPAKSTPAPATTKTTTPTTTTTQPSAPATTPTPAAPTVSLSASPSSITTGQSATLTWSSTNATSCIASNAWSGSKATSGSVSTGTLTATSTYALACTGSGGNANTSATVTVNPLTPLGVSGSWTMKFDDEFTADSSLNTTTWSPDWFGSGNTQNQTLMLSSNVSVSGGDLNLEVTSSSGGIVSTNPDDGQPGHGGYQFTYGYAESKIYLPASSSKIANWPAWWTNGQSWPTDGEMDIMEGLGGLACFHFHYTGGAPGGCATGNYSGWHTYGANWQPGSVTYYYDGIQVGKITTGITSMPMYLILENSTGSYGGTVVTPADMLVAYVRVWQ